MPERKFFAVYQVLAPLLILPLAYWLWLRHLGDHLLALEVMLIPVLVSYIVPGIGTNRLHLWEFNTKLRLGKFRAHHGFVFGAGTALLSYAALGQAPSAPGFGDALRGGFVLACVLGLINWAYDIAAIRAGFIKVYIKSAAQGASAETVATQYAPVYFGAFGFSYGIVLRLLQGCAVDPSLRSQHLLIALLGFLAVLVIPCLAFIAFSLWTTGEHGLKAYPPTAE